MPAAPGSSRAPRHLPGSLIQRTTSTGRSARWITLCAVLPSIEPGQVAASPRSHHDDISIVFLSVIDDLAGCMAEDRVPHHAVRRDPGLGQFIDGGLDRGLGIVGRLTRNQPGPGHDLALAQVQHPDLAVRQGRQVTGRAEHALGDL